MGIPIGPLRKIQEIIKHFSYQSDDMHMSPIHSPRIKPENSVYDRNKDLSPALGGIPTHYNNAWGSPTRAPRFSPTPKGSEDHLDRRLLIPTDEVSLALISLV